VQNETNPSFRGDNVLSNFPQKEFQPSIEFKFPEKLQDMRLERNRARSNSRVADHSVSRTC
jgi:hypothetical protein